MKKLLIIFMLGLLVFANDTLYQFNDKDSLMIYPDTTYYLGMHYNKWEKIVVYAETCICEEVNVLIIKYSDDKPLIIWEQNKEKN